MSEFSLGLILLLIVPLFPIAFLLWATNNISSTFWALLVGTMFGFVVYIMIVGSL